MTNRDPAQAFSDLARDFKRAGDSAAQKRLYKALYESAQPMIDAVKVSAQETLPNGGGRGRRKTRLKKTGTVTVGGTEYVTRKRVKTKKLAEPESLAQRAGKAKYRIKATGGRRPRVRITGSLGGKEEMDLVALDEGHVRHPLFGNRKHWYQQTIVPGWFSKPCEGQAPAVRVRLEQAVAGIEKDIFGS